MGDASQQPWRFIADGVMGGVSTGRLDIQRDGDAMVARMTGHVSTANNGGFIQIRLPIDPPLPLGLEGVRLVVRGNDQRYFVHLRSRNVQSPTLFHRAAFDAETAWREVRLPFAGFTASRAGLPPTPTALAISSVAVVAWGRDHEADVSVREIGFY